jgi:hypothetical protein
VNPDADGLRGVRKLGGPIFLGCDHCLLAGPICAIASDHSLPSHQALVVVLGNSFGKVRPRSAREQGEFAFGKAPVPVGGDELPVWKGQLGYDLGPLGGRFPTAGPSGFLDTCGEAG